MARKYAIIILLFALVFLSACARKVDPAESAYATAYMILTRTAEVLARLPSTTPLPAQPSSQPSAQIPTQPLAPTTLAAPSPSPSAPPAAVPLTATLPPAVNLQPSATQPQLQNPSFPSNTPQPTSTSSLPTSTAIVPAPSQGLLGIWQQAPQGWVLQFNPDGTYRLSSSYRDLLTDVLDEGQYVIQNDQVTLSGSANSLNCKLLAGSYQFQTPANGQRLLNRQQDVCYERQLVISDKPWYWLPVRPGASPPVFTAVEQPLTIIPLSGPLTNPEAKVAGLAWAGDTLLILPERPSFLNDGRSYLFALSRSDLAAILNGVIRGPLSPQQLTLVDASVTAQIPGFLDYQALEVIGERVYLLAQGSLNNSPSSYLVSGSLSAELTSLTLDSSKIVELPLQPVNASRPYRSLLANADTLLALPELAGLSSNPAPQALRYDSSLSALGSLPLTGIEYSLSAASRPDGTGRFWALNRWLPGEPGGLAGLDPLALLYGEGVTHQVFDQVERLAAFQVTANGVVLSASAPLQLELSARGPRDWQGLAEFGDQGFLLAGNQSGVILVFLGSLGEN